MIPLIHSKEPRLQAAINGARSGALVQAIPVTTAAIVEAAVSSVQAGAQSIHFHVHNAVGLQSLAGTDVAVQMQAIKAALPDVPVGISTVASIEPSLEKRIGAIKQWSFLPDYVSVNGHEEGFDQVVLLLRRMGAPIEAGVRDAAAAKAFIQKGMLSHCFRILIEPASQDPAEAMATVEEIEEILLGEISNQTILLHGVDNTAWPMISLAASRGYETRMGFEDTLFVSSGAPAINNVSLVAEAAGIYFPNFARTQKKA